MIRFEDGFSDLESIFAQYRRGSPEYEALSKLSESSRSYVYLSREELEFELSLRKGIIDASLALYRRRLPFRIFQESFCNEAYWDRRQDGGFVLKSGARPSRAVEDIFISTRMYGTECATAIVIIYYKAVLDVYMPELFDRAFPRIVLMNWRDMDQLIDPATYRGLADYLPGDCRYVRNPDVDPLTPEWQGENVIDLGNGRYYGHGIGLGSIDYFIDALNRNRREGSQASAYLMDTATRPDFRSLHLYRKNAS